MDNENQTLRFLKNTLDHWVKEGDHDRVQHTVDLIKKEMTAMELKMAKDAQRGDNVLRVNPIKAAYNQQFGGPLGGNIQRFSNGLLGNPLGVAPRPVTTMHRLPPRDFTNNSDEYFKRAQEQAARQHIAREMYLNSLKTFQENATSRRDHCPGEFLANLKEDVKELRRHYDLLVDVTKDQDRHKQEAPQDRIRAIETKASAQAGLTAVEPAIKATESAATTVHSDMAAPEPAVRYGATLEELAELESEIGIETPAESEANSSMGWRTDCEVEEDIITEAKMNTEKTETVAKMAEEPIDRLETCVNELAKVLREERQDFLDMTAHYTGVETKAANAENRVKELEKKLKDLGDTHLNDWTKHNEELKESTKLEQQLRERIAATENRASDAKIKARAAEKRANELERQYEKLDDAYAKLCERHSDRMDECAKLEEELNERIAAAEKRANDAEKKARIAERRVKAFDELSTDDESNFNARPGSWGCPTPLAVRRAATDCWGRVSETTKHHLNDEVRNGANVYPGEDYYNAIAEQSVATAQARLAEAETCARKKGEACQDTWGNSGVTDPFGYPHGWATESIPAEPASSIGEWW